MQRKHRSCQSKGWGCVRPERPSGVVRHAEHPVRNRPHPAANPRHGADLPAEPQHRRQRSPLRQAAAHRLAKPGAVAAQRAGCPVAPEPGAVLLRQRVDRVPASLLGGAEVGGVPAQIRLESIRRHALPDQPIRGRREVDVLAEASAAPTLGGLRPATGGGGGGAAVVLAPIYHQLAVAWPPPRRARPHPNRRGAREVVGADARAGVGEVDAVRRERRANAAAVDRAALAVVEEAVLVGARVKEEPGVPARQQQRVSGGRCGRQTASTDHSRRSMLLGCHCIARLSPSSDRASTSPSITAPCCLRPRAAAPQRAALDSRARASSRRAVADPL